MVHGLDKKTNLVSSGMACNCSTKSSDRSAKEKDEGGAVPPSRERLADVCREGEESKIT